MTWARIKLGIRPRSIPSLRQQPVHVVVRILEWHTSQLWAFVLWHSLVGVRINSRIEDSDVMVCCNERHQTRDVDGTFVLVVNNYYQKKWAVLEEEYCKTCARRVQQIQSYGNSICVKRNMSRARNPLLKHTWAGLETWAELEWNQEYDVSKQHLPVQISVCDYTQRFMLRTLTKGQIL